MIIFVLIMVLHGGTTQSGISVVQQEFTSRQACEAAREHIAKSLMGGWGTHIKSQGCYAK